MTVSTCSRRRASNPTGVTGEWSPQPFVTEYGTGVGGYGRPSLLVPRRWSRLVASRSLTYLAEGTIRSTPATQRGVVFEAVAGIMFRSGVRIP